MTGFGAELLGWDETALALVEQQRGWTEAVIERLELGWRETEQRVVIPIRDPTGDELGLLRYDPTGLRRPKMLADNGVPRELFPPPEMLADVALVWLVEGEPDAIRLWSLGLTAVGVPGAQNWRDEWAARFSGRHWTIAVCFDCDRAGRENAPRAAHALQAAGLDVRLVDLDPGRDDGYDLTDYVQLATNADLRVQAATTLLQIVEQTPAYRPPGAVELVVQSLEAFVAVQEPGATAILGTADNAVIPQGGDAMVYGDGGVGKTTLCVDLACHLAAGDDWLGLTVPHPVRVLLIENEGPRPLFRRKLERKLAGWAGSPIEGRVEVLEQPWGELDLVSGAWREALAQVVAAREIDVVLVGPLTSIGMEGAGTIAEARAFLHLVENMRAQSGRPIAIIIVHHENKGGKVSGAWEGAGDTLLHVTQLGHAQLRLYFQKARWASEQHATTLQLAWAPGDSFALTGEQEENRAEAVWLGLEDFVLRNPGCSWKDITSARNEDGTKVVRGQLDYLARRRDQMLEEGVLIDAGAGRNFKLWHRDDPVRPQVIEDEENDPSEW